jgi:aromatic-L-amino-acid decarboxylase
MTDFASDRDTSDDLGGSAPSYHMDPDEFRRHGHALVDWLARYMETVGRVIDYRDWQVPLGRRFRALKLWWVLRSYGAEGIRHHLREHIRLTGTVAARIEQHDHLALTAPVSFGLVCFRHRWGNEATSALLDAINSVPNVYLTGSSLGSERFIRVSIGSTWTTAEDVDRLWSIIDRAAYLQSTARSYWRGIST